MIVQQPYAHFTAKMQYPSMINRMSDQKSCTLNYLCREGKTSGIAGM